jgi:hypothetical protein
MATIKRIRPHEVAEAYKKTGMKMYIGCFLSHDGQCGCGMGVYAVANLGVDRYSEKSGVNIACVLKDIGFSYDYLAGFGHGFDGDEASESAYPKDMQYATGYDDGIAAYAAAKEVVNV